MDPAELIAPPTVVFYSSRWTELGTKFGMTSDLHNITGISPVVLQRGSLQEVSVAERMRWAVHRKTTRPEDVAYCLMGIFDVNMPMLYGEGSNAFIRPQEEILRNSEDQSLFAWEASQGSADRAPYRGLFAVSRDIVPFPGLRAFQTPVAPTNRGIPLTSILSSILDSEPTAGTNTRRRVLVGFNCHKENERDKMIVAIELVSRGGDQYLRSNPHKLFRCAPSGPTTTVYVSIYSASDRIDPVPDADRQHPFYFRCLPPGVTVCQVVPPSAESKFFAQPLGDRAGCSTRGSSRWGRESRTCPSRSSPRLCGVSICSRSMSRSCSRGQTLSPKRWQGGTQTLRAGCRLCKCT